MMPIIVLPILFISFVTFGLTGFGSGLVAMSLLVPIIGVEVAAPMFALLAIAAELLMLLRYRHSANFRSVWRLALGSLIAIPLGLTVIHNLDDSLVLVLLGVVVAGYGLYSLTSPHLPYIHNPNWAFPFGFISGVLTGAYNTGGPPVVIYGNLARWEREEYKSNLPGMFILNSIVVISSHALSGHYNPSVLQTALMGLPVMLVGLVVGWSLDRYINPETFRKLVLVLLVLIGLRLILVNIQG